MGNWRNGEGEKEGYREGERGRGGITTCTSVTLFSHMIRVTAKAISTLFFRRRSCDAVTVQLHHWGAHSTAPKKWSKCLPLLVQIRK